MKQPSKPMVVLNAVKLSPAEMKSYGISPTASNGIFCNETQEHIKCPSGYTQVGYKMDTDYEYGPIVGLVCRKNNQDHIIYCSGYDPNWDNSPEVGTDPYDACSGASQNDVCRYKYNGKTYEGLCMPDNNTQLFCSGTKEI